MPNKFNPFRPNNIINPGSFVGRVEELVTIEKCLFQTKHGNPQHFLVHGERGIGKSSLLLYVQALANGKFKNPDNGKPEFSFLTINIDLGTCQTQIDIIRKIARGFSQAINRTESFKGSAKSIYEWLTNWEVLGVRYHKPENIIDTEEIIEELVFKLDEFCQQLQGQSDGVLILMDEADRPPVEADLGELLKFMTERLTVAGANNVIFGLAGLPTLLGKLRDSHPSSPRVFEIMSLEPLDLSERAHVIHIGLKEANRQNDKDTAITKEAETFLSELTEGYPHFIQQFAYCAFDADFDYTIDEEDVSRGAFIEGGALTQLGDKFFNELYHTKISSDEYRNVLKTMAPHGDNWITRKDIIQESNIPEKTVDNALAALRSRGIINYDDTRPRQGYYRLPTRSFASWIKAFKSIEERSGGQMADLFPSDPT